MKALIDADSIIYKYASINQDVIEWEPDVTSVFFNIRDAKIGISRHIDEILENTGCTEALLVLSPSTNFRYDVLSTYKWNRKKPSTKLELLMPLKRWVYETFNVHVPCYVEADDFCVWLTMFEPTKWVICHIDKDLDQAPGKHYNYSKQKNYYISEQEAEYKFYEQVLVGDTSDGYKGCPNIGKVRCARILDPDSAHLGEQRTTWELIVDTYASKGLTHEDALQQARVARMLTPNEWDGADNIELWSPIDGD